MKTSTKTASNASYYKYDMIGNSDVMGVTVKSELTDNIKIDCTTKQAKVSGKNISSYDVSVLHNAYELPEEKVETVTDKNLSEIILSDNNNQIVPTYKTKQLSSIAVTSMPSVTKYKYSKKGTELNTDGLTITATYSDGSTEVIDNSEIEFSGLDTSSRGKKTVTASYEGAAVTFEVEVKFTFWQWLLYIFCFGWIWM